MSKTGIIIQARMGSTRLPGKVMLSLAGKPMLQHVVERCKKVNVDEVIVATSINKKDDIIEDFCKQEGYKCYRGPEKDVLARYFYCAKKFSLGTIIRVTADDPFIDYEVINQMLRIYFNGQWDYVVNNLVRSFPYGLDCNVFSFSVLDLMFKNAKKPDEREHVVPYVLNNKEKFKISNLKSNIDYSHYLLTVDTLDDYWYAHYIYSHIYPKNRFFLLKDIIKFIEGAENEGR